MDFCHGLLDHKMTEIARQQIAAELPNCGVRGGSVLFVHSSLSSIGTVAGGAEAAVAAIIDVLGSEGTLAVPTFTFSHGDGAVFDPQRDASEMGAISEVLRCRHQAHRSRHINHSVAAAGKHGCAIARRHGASAWAADGPFWQLFELDADILLLGVPYLRCTLFHVIEQMVQVPYREWRERSASVVEPDGSRKSLPARIYAPKQGFVGNDFNRLGRLLEMRGLVRNGSVGNAITRLFRARDVLELGVAEYRENPDLFIKSGGRYTALAEGVLTDEPASEKWVRDPARIYERD